MERKGSHLTSRADEEGSPLQTVPYPISGRRGESPCTVRFYGPVYRNNKQEQEAVDSDTAMFHERVRT